MCNKELTNKQNDVAWMAAHRCLPTREFQRRRRLIDSEVCPREGCRRVESVDHLFWGCGYANEVWKGMVKMIKGLTGVENVSFEMMMFGLCAVGKSEKRTLWLLANCVKESLWDVRNILIFRKEEVTVRGCVSMIHGRLYAFAYGDIKKMGYEVAEKIWWFDGWKEW